MSDPFSHWAANLKGEKVVITSTDFHPGFYKVWRGKGAPYTAGSIYIGEGGKLFAERDGKSVDLTEDFWLSVVKRPVSYEAYTFHREHGRWPDDPEPNPRAVIGGNLPPPELPLESEAKPASSDAEFDAILTETYKTTLTAREVWKELTISPLAERVIADKAQNVSDLLMRQSREAKALKDIRKRPIIDAGNAIEDHFRDLIARPKDVSERLKARILEWQRADRAERQRIADEEAAKIAEARRVAHEQAQAAAAARQEEPPPPLAPEKPAEAEYLALGGSVAGHRTKPKRIVRARIVDIEACFGFFRGHADVRDVLQKLANAAIKKQPVPGCEEDEGERI